MNAKKPESADYDESPPLHEEDNLALIAKEEAALAERRRKAEARIEGKLPEWRQAIEQYALETYGVPLSRILGTKTKGKSKGTRSGVSADKSCPICKFKTTPPHDKRKHRFEEDPSKPFTKTKLEELHLIKVE